MNNLLIIGDVHCNLKALYSLISKYQDKVCAAIQVGDFGLYHSEDSIGSDKKILKKHNQFRLAEKIISKLQSKTLDPLPIPLYYIKGNHDDFDNLDSVELRRLNIHYLPQGSITEINGRLVGAMGGIFSPKRRTLDASNFTGREKRFYTLTEIDDLLADYRSDAVEILVTHQAADGVLPEKCAEGTKDFVPLLKMRKLRYYLHGHHHISYEENVDGIQCIGLGNFGSNQKSYKII